MIIAAADHHDHHNNHRCGGQKRRSVSIYWKNPNSINETARAPFMGPRSDELKVRSDPMVGCHRWGLFRKLPLIRGSCPL
jgi:hypothetical protein